MSNQEEPVFTIWWDNDHFDVDENLELLKHSSLTFNKPYVINFLRCCDFDLLDYDKWNDTWQIKKTDDIYFPIEDEGTGFTILFNLIGYVLTGKDLLIMENSFCRQLPSTLWKEIKNAFERRKATCKWMSPIDVRPYLKCAVNPLGDCNNCPHFKPLHNQIIIFSINDIKHYCLSD